MVILFKAVILSVRQLISLPFYSAESGLFSILIETTAKSAARMANMKCANFIFALHSGWAWMSEHGKVNFEVEDDLPFVGTWMHGARSSRGNDDRAFYPPWAEAETTPKTNRKSNRFNATHLIEQKVMNFPCREQRMHHHPFNTFPASIEVVSSVSPT